MNKNKKLLVALSVATMLATNGLVMAATPTGQQDVRSGQAAHEFADKSGHEKKGGMRVVHGDDSALLDLLKIDADTFKEKIDSGQTLLDIANEQGVPEQTLRDFVAEHMTQRLDEGVANGRISAEKAQQIKDNMDQHVSDIINGKGPMQGHKGHGPGFAANEKLLELLKIDAETLNSELQAGKTLAAIAKEQGVSEKKLKSVMAAEMTARIDEGVQAGRINSDQAKTMKKDLDKRVTDMINGKAPMHRSHGPKQGALANNQELLALLKTDAQTLQSELKDKTLAEFAKEQGVSEQELKALLVSQMTSRIDEAEQAGRLTADKAQQAKENLDERVDDMINGKAPMHRGHGPKQGALVNNQELLALLKTDAQTLQSELKGGKTLAEFAEEQGVSEQELKALLVSQMTSRIDEAEQAGRLTADQAQQAQAGLDERVDDMINGKAPMHRGHRPNLFNNQELLALLKTDAQTLQSELKGGKTLAEFAEEQGVSEQELKALLVSQMTSRIDEAEENGRLTADQAQQAKENLDERVDDMINGKPGQPQPREKVDF